jgi:aspartate/methionine/tyrosine aminotransferase
MNPLATELNTALSGTVAGRLLSPLGKRLYFPKGIIAQSAEAKKLAHTANATIGMAFKDGKPIMLSAIKDNLPGLSAGEAVAYAPTAGLEPVREAWKQAMLQKNPSINADYISVPVVVPGLTAGISYMADMFLGEGIEILSTDPCWDNYGLVFTDRCGATMRELPIFKADGSGLDIPRIEASLTEAAKSGAIRCILNFPQNPSGYSATKSEADELVRVLSSIAEAGTDVLVLCDDAYFGLAYEDDIYPESIFGKLSKAHKNLLAVKIDGPTKEDYVWGLRMGFITFGSLGLEAAAKEALVKKLMGAIRSSVSCANTPAQNLMLKTLADSRSAGEKAEYKELLQSRYRAVKQFLAANPAHPVLKPLPFNSGYFMCFECVGKSAESIRRALLEKHGVGTIALGERYLRVAFASVETDKIPSIYKTVFETAAE